ncbi:MAG: shikimate dehydrogenase [Spirochaetales bacterium]|nr:shikimate dehydrogenase [Spirochaetales bacterium]
MSSPPSFKQELTAVFGQPVAENPTQAMIEAAYRHHGLPWRYLTIEVAPDALGDAVRGARAMGFAGFNLTIPHKVAVIEHLDGLGESARLIGAVNCVVPREGRLIGENTDGKGFLQALRAHTDPRGKRVLIFGAGGAARAIAVELALAGASAITVVNRSTERGRALVELLRGGEIGVAAELAAWKGEHTVAPATDVVINATSIGLFPNVEARVPVDLDSLSPGMIVADVIPNPPRTHLVRSAEERGCVVLDGLGMLVNQGVIGVQYWTGVSPDAEVMRRALLDVFAG